MPKSKSKRSTYKPPPKPRPKPSPRWVPWVGLGLILLGLVIVLLHYLVTGFLPGGNYNLVVGFAFMAVGLGVLSTWR